ncbi:porin [Marinobacter sp. R17]|nr:porin [Marinobacter sp. R17]
MRTKTTKQQRTSLPAKRGLSLALIAALSLPALPALAATSLEDLQQQLEVQRQQIEALQKQQAQAPEPGSLADRSDVSLYGVLDTGVEHITNIGEDSDGLTRIPAITGTMASRLGIDAHIDIAEGYRGLAKLEMGFNADDGTQGQGGRLFGRQLYVGLQTPYGRLTVGRQYSVFLFAQGTSDLIGPNIYALGSLDAYLPNARYDNSLSWMHRFTDRISAGVSYSFGRDTSGGVPASGTCGGESLQVGDSSACQAWSAMLKYDAGTFGLAAAIDTLNGGDGAQAFFFNGQPPVDMSDSGDTDRRTSLGGYVKLGDGKVGVGWLGRELDTAATNIQSDAYYVTANYKFTPKFTLDGGVYDITNDDQDADATLAVIRGIYNLASGLDTYAQMGYITNSDNAAYAVSGAGPNTAPAAGESQEGYMVGLRYKF